MEKCYNTYAWILLIKGITLVLQITYVLGSSCQDIDHNACVSMASQMPDMCSNPNIGLSACPFYCNMCPTVCYSCERSNSNITGCNTITCRVNQMCLLKTVVNETSTTYKMSCDTKQICSDKRRTSNLDIHCCNTNLCNVPSLPTTSASTLSLLPSTVQPSTASNPPSTTVAPIKSTITPSSAVPNTSTSTPSTTILQPSTVTPMNFSTYRPYYLTTWSPWIRPYTLTTIPQQHNVSPYNPPSANINMMHSINASCQSSFHVFVDESCSNYTYTNIVKRILQDTINQLDIGPTKVHVAMSTFNTSVYNHWDLNSYHNKQDVLYALNQLAMHGTGYSNIRAVVDSLLDNSAPADVVLIFSNNRHMYEQGMGSTSRYRETVRAKLNEIYRSLIIIGVDNADIYDISTDPAHVFNIPPYSHDYMVEWILHEICPEVVY